MIKLMFACLIAVPALAHATPLQFGATGNSYKLSYVDSAYAGSTIIYSDYKNLARFNTDLVSKSNFMSVNNLPNENKFGNKFTQNQFTQNPDAARQPSGKAGSTIVTAIIHSSNLVETPSAIPLLATAIGLFGFAANRRRV